VAAIPKIELTIARRSQPPRRTSTRKARSHPRRLGQIARQNEPVVTSKYPSGRPLLTDTAPQTEFVLTCSKQTAEKFLTEARTHIKLFEFLPFPTQISGQLIQGSATQHRAECASGRPLLLDSALQVEFVLTRSKQTTEKFLLDTRTHIKLFKFLPFSTQNPGQLIQRLPIDLRCKNPKNTPTVNVYLSRCLTRASLRSHTRPSTLAPLFHVLCEDAHGHEPHTSENNGGTMKRAALLVLLFATLAPAAPAPDDYTINVHVTSSYKFFVGSTPAQGLDVVINGKKYQLGGQYKGGLLAFGDYKAKLSKDQHPNAYESNQEYELLFPDNKTRTYVVFGQSE
jgi:hypothetical protein